MVNIESKNESETTLDRKTKSCLSRRMTPMAGLCQMFTRTFLMPRGQHQGILQTHILCHPVGHCLCFRSVIYFIRFGDLIISFGN